MDGNVHLLPQEESKSVQFLGKTTETQKAEINCSWWMVLTGGAAIHSASHISKYSEKNFSAGHVQTSLLSLFPKNNIATIYKALTVYINNLEMI